MSDPFIGEIQIYGFNFAPANWAYCNGQLMSVSQNTALFSLLGTTFGGDGRTTFALPNFQGQVACGQGNGPGLTPRVQGETFGSATATLSYDQMPAHNHSMRIFTQSDSTKRFGTPANGSAAMVPGLGHPFTPAVTSTTSLPSTMIGTTGGNGAHPNMQPYLAMNFCICLSGQFPQRP